MGAEIVKWETLQYKEVDPNFGTTRPDEMTIDELKIIGSLNDKGESSTLTRPDETRLHEAVHSSDIVKAEHLLDLGAPLNFISPASHLSPFHLAILKDNYAMVEMFLRKQNPKETLATQVN